LELDEYRNKRVFDEINIIITGTEQFGSFQNEEGTKIFISEWVKNLAKIGESY